LSHRSILFMGDSILLSDHHRAVFGHREDCGTIPLVRLFRPILPRLQLQHCKFRISMCSIRTLVHLRTSRLTVLYQRLRLQYTQRVRGNHLLPEEPNMRWVQCRVDTEMVCQRFAFCLWRARVSIVCIVVTATCGLLLRISCISPPCESIKSSTIEVGIKA